MFVNAEQNAKATMQNPIKWSYIGFFEK